MEAARSEDLDLAAYDLAAILAPLRPVPGLAERARAAPGLRWLAAAEPWSSVEQCTTWGCAWLRMLGVADPARPLDALGPPGIALAPEAVPQWPSVRVARRAPAPPGHAWPPLP